jgi:hypothetical protein
VALVSAVAAASSRPGVSAAITDLADASESLVVATTPGAVAEARRAAVAIAAIAAGGRRSARWPGRLGSRSNPRRLDRAAIAVAAEARSRPPAPVGATSRSWSPHPAPTRPGCARRSPRPAPARSTSASTRAASTSKRGKSRKPRAVETSRVLPPAAGRAPPPARPGHKLDADDLAGLDGGLERATA